MIEQSNELSPRIICFTQTGISAANKVAQAINGNLLTPDDLDAGGLREAVREGFARGETIIGVCAAGILIRLLADLLDDKKTEPPVLAVSHDLSSMVPLLGGHRGANELAKTLSAAIGGQAAITTGSETQFDFALDDLPPEYACADVQGAKNVMAKALNGQSLRTRGEAEFLKDAGYAVDVLAEDASSDSADIVITTRAPSEEALTIHPRTLVVGMGCARGTPATDIIQLVENSFAANQLATASLAAIATIDIKGNEAGLQKAAQHFGVPLRVFTANELKSASENVPNPSPVVDAEVGTPSVAEAAASLAGQLMVPKVKTASATLAISETKTPKEVGQLGRSVGRLQIVGIGPGEHGQRTKSCVNALREATDWVGYGLYLDLINDLHLAQHQHRFDLGAEEDRVRFALELAGEGKNVALVCSGDGQIYAMAALVEELLAENGPRAVSQAAQYVPILTHPGISAFQMASARAGALIGHDFCCISLSDLLTPRDQILKRVEAAAQGDFVVAFYNPKSKKRTQLLDQSIEILAQHRTPQTPIIIASNLGRTDEKVTIVPLEKFNSDVVDMLTLVMVGSSQSQTYLDTNKQVRAFTPRGYAGKHEGSDSSETAK